MDVFVFNKIVGIGGQVSGLVKEGMYNEKDFKNNTKKIQQQFTKKYPTRITVNQEEAADYIKRELDSYDLSKVLENIPKTVLFKEVHYFAFSLGNNKLACLFRDNNFKYPYSEPKTRATCYTKEYILRSFLESKGYKVNIYEVSADTPYMPLCENIYADLVNGSVDTEKAKNLFIDEAVRIACDHNDLNKKANRQVIESCYKVEEKYNDMVLFLQRFMSCDSEDSSQYILNETEIKAYLESIGLIK